MIVFIKSANVRRRLQCLSESFICAILESYYKNRAVSDDGRRKTDGWLLGSLETYCVSCRYAAGINWGLNSNIFSNKDYIIDKWCFEIREIILHLSYQPSKSFNIICACTDKIPYCCPCNNFLV